MLKHKTTAQCPIATNHRVASQWSVTHLSTQVHTRPLIIIRQGNKLKDARERILYCIGSQATVTKRSFCD